MDSQRFTSFSNTAKIFREYEGYKNMTKKEEDMNMKKDDAKKNKKKQSVIA